MGKTLFDKIYDKHVVSSIPDGPDVFYIDVQYIHEVTSPQAFTGLRNRGIEVARPKQICATADHNVPTENQHLPIQNDLSRHQVSTLVKNCEEFGIELYGLGHPFQGIVHVVGPELGVSQPGMTMVCGDSHTSTHGAFGAIAFGIGTSEVEQVMASQCLLQHRSKTMRITVDGKVQKGVTAKDIVLYVCSKVTAGGGTGYFIEFAGSAFTDLSMEGRMTVCNMSIEMGARGGLIAPDQTTFDYVQGRDFAPKGTAWDKSIDEWKTLATDDDAIFDKEFNFDATDIEPMITYGTNPGMGVGITQNIPSASDIGAKSEKEIESFDKSLDYMNFKVGETMMGKSVDYVFVGSCTNARIEDFREVAQIVKGRQKSDNVVAWLVPGSKQVEKQIHEEGLAKIIEAAGFKIRQPGCSACLAMNDDKVPTGAYCVSTSNRNFEGRQGPGARTMLASPMTAAATAIAGVIANPADLI
jgi:3-isopropylmalate/(R)-2-methylmalate dehydratase large subunit